MILVGEGYECSEKGEVYEWLGHDCPCSWKLLQFGVLK